MTRSAPLRAVKPGDSRSAPRKTVAQAAESGSRRDLLVAMRDRIAKAVSDPDCPPRDLAALSRRLQDLAKEIEALDAEEEKDDVGHAADTPDEEWPSS